MMIESQVMQFDLDIRPKIGDYIEFDSGTQRQYSVSWYCSDVIGITDDGGFHVRYDGGYTTYYITAFDCPYISTYGNAIYPVSDY